MAENTMKGLTYLGEVKGYQAFRNDEGYIELYKARGRVTSRSQSSLNKQRIDRIITRFTELSEVKFHKDKPVKYDPNQKNQLRIE